MAMGDWGLHLYAICIDCAFGLAGFYYLALHTSRYALPLLPLPLAAPSSKLLPRTPMGYGRKT
jgi:hypothetical protein